MVWFDTKPVLLAGDRYFAVPDWKDIVWFQGKSIDGCDDIWFWRHDDEYDHLYPYVCFFNGCCTGVGFTFLMVF